MARLDYQDAAACYDGARLSRRADTTLVALDDADFAAGLAALDAAVAAEAVPAPVIDRLDLLVLRRC